MPRLRHYAIGTGVIVLLAVVAVAATAGGGAAGGRGGWVEAPRAVLNVGSVLLIAGMVFGGVFVAYELVVIFSSGTPPRQPVARRWWSPLVTLAVVVAMTVCLYLLARLLGLRRKGGGGQFGRALAGGRLHLPAEQAKIPPAVSGTDALWGVALGLVALAAVVAFGRRGHRRSVQRRPERPPHPPEREVVPEPGGLVDVSMDALLAEADPRRAVISAYQSMQSWLGRAGLGREPWEAPFEHLARVLRSLGASGAVATRLAGLFERAKFDRRPCGPEMKQQALEALADLRANFSSPKGDTIAETHGAT